MTSYRPWSKTGIRDILFLLAERYQWSEDVAKKMSSARIRLLIEQVDDLERKKRAAADLQAAKRRRR